MKAVRDFFVLFLFFSLMTYFVMFFKREDGALLSKNYEKLSEISGKEDYLVIWEEGSLRMRLPMENFLVGSLAATIPVTYEDEVLKAQAIVLRSELSHRYAEKKAGGETGHCLSLKSEDWSFWNDRKMQNVWGEEYELHLKKCMDAVLQTQGVYLAYDSRPVRGFFHAMSAGKTRNGEVLSPAEEYGYLKETVCADNLSDLQYEEKKQVPIEQVGKLSEGTSDEAGYLISVKQDGELITGEELRSCLGFSSSHITWETQGAFYCFTIRGKGHGFGLDQYCGNQLARKGKDYKEILETFFADITFQRVE